MAYIGVSPSNGVRRVHTYTATASQTTFSGAGAEGTSLSYKDSNYVDVYQNGVKLGDADYTATSGTSIVLGTGASASDLVVIVVFDVFSVADTVSKADGGTFDGNVTMAGTLTGTTATFSTADNNPQLILKSTDADADRGPVVQFTRDSASPADNDILGRMQFLFDNDAGETTTAVQIEAAATDVSDSSEDASLNLVTMVGGTTRGRLKFTSSEAVFNEDSIDSDFRVESDGNANMIFVDGGNDKVGIGNNNPNDFGSVASDLVIGTTSGEHGLSIVSGTGNGGRIQFADNTSSPFRGAFEYDHSSDHLIVYTAGSARMRITDGGLIHFARSNNDFTTEGATINQGGGTTAFVTGAGPCCTFSRTSNDGVLISLRQDGTEEGTISISGTTTSFNGGHLSRWSRLLNNSKDETIVKGTVMTNLDEMVEWGDEDNEQLNKMAVSSVEGDVNVAGVFVNWDNDDDWNDMNVAMTGDMVIRIAKGTTVARGDLLMSAGDGTAKPQGDDIVRSKTIAKVTSTNVSHTYDDGTYLVPCVVMAC